VLLKLDLQGTKSDPKGQGPTREPSNFDLTEFTSLEISATGRLPMSRAPCARELAFFVYCESRLAR
jgi:hypothetical protein